jgi:hypothetical protein
MPNEESENTKKYVAVARYSSITGGNIKYFGGTLVFNANRSS